MTGAPAPQAGASFRFAHAHMPGLWWPRAGKLVNVMGDKSPKNTRKDKKQKADAKVAKDHKKHPAPEAGTAG
jgi:hypothetical protein